MKIVAYIPVKLNNERFPNKNLKCFDDGTPLCHLVFNTLSAVEEIDEIYCYCSNPKIKEYLTGRVKFLQRSESLDTPETRCGDIIKSFLNDVDTDIVVMSHVTSPFLKSDTVVKCLNAVKKGAYDSAFTVNKFQDYLWKNGKPLNFDASNIVRSQDLPVIYKEACDCYVFTRQLFEKHSRRIGFNPFICEVDKIEAIDINYSQDFEIANAVYMHILKNSVNRNVEG